MPRGHHPRVLLLAAASASVGIVVGFLLGGIAPRLEVQARQAEIAELERQLAEAPTGGWRSPVPGLDRILRVGEAERPLPLGSPERQPESGRPDDVDERSAERYEPDGGVPDGGMAADRRWQDGWRERGPTERLTAFQRAASIQRVRRVQSRAALIQQAGLDEDAQVELDEALQEMNEALYGHGEELIMLAMSDEPPAARDLLGITHDLTGIMHRAQLRIEAVVGPERVADVDESALEIWNHVDLAQLEPAARAALRGSP
ncbi:MAG TPA: hypothetical protein ENK57_06260 [Polyangiaceae bacterium]|nr:hypothetical protein [Polyangiaceae bacterium]